MESSDSSNISPEPPEVVTTPPPDISQSLQFAFNPAVDPAGNKFVGVSVLMGTCSFTWGIPLASVDEFTRMFRAECHKAAQAAMNVPGAGNGSGLVIPQVQSVRDLPNFDPRKHVR